MNEEAPCFTDAELDRAYKTVVENEWKVIPSELVVTLAALNVKGINPIVAPLMIWTPGGNYRVSGFVLSMIDP